MFKVNLEDVLDYGSMVTAPNAMIRTSPTRITSTTISPLGSALIFLRSSSKEDPWSPSRNKTTQYRWNSTDGVEIQTLPVTNENAHAVVAAYCVLFAIAAVGNVSVFASLLRRRHRKSRVSLLIKHLAAADLIVTFVMIPLEIGWRMTSQWLAGNGACKFFLFLRAFGLYLSSNVLVCISLDRYFAVVYPLKVKDTRRRGKIMLTFAWLTALLCSLPQSVVFHVLAHPEVPNFYQCVTFGFFETRRQEVAYNLFCLLAMYFIPLLVISFAYSRIFCVIASKSRIDSNQGGRQTDPGEQFRGRVLLRRSDISNIERARARTLRMTITIVAAFVWCWTPYVLMTMWYMFDRESAQKVDARVQDAFFIMAVSNSCMNPLLYGSYSTNFWRECNRRFSKILKNNQNYQNSSPENSLPTLSMESSGTNS